MGVPGPTWVRRRFFSGLSTPDLAAVLLRFADCYWNFQPRQRRLWRGCRRIVLLDRAMEHSHQKRKSRAARRQVEFSAVIPQHEDDMSLAIEKIIDISLELDPTNFGMRTPAGFKKDMQIEMEVLKEHDAPQGAGQIVRGVHMRLHAGSHIDAPEHNVKGGKQVQDLPLEMFAGDAVVADLRHRVPGGAITAEDLEKAAADVKKGERLLLRTDVNKQYMVNDWQKRSPYLAESATRWCIEKGVTVVGYDFYHGN